MRQREQRRYCMIARGGYLARFHVHVQIHRFQRRQQTIVSRSMQAIEDVQPLRICEQHFRSAVTQAVLHLT